MVFPAPSEPDFVSAPTPNFRKRARSRVKMLKPDKELINFWLSYAESHLLWHDPEQLLIHGFPPPNAMGVPEKEAYENHILAMKEGNGA
jgi:hypothetical protein